jgi:hypothetical protein
MSARTQIIGSLARVAAERGAPATVAAYLDAATTAFGRATAYNTREEQQAAELHIHRELLALSRDLYAALLTLPGTTDRSVQLGVRNLLSTARGDTHVITREQERMLAGRLLAGIPITRALKVMDTFRLREDALGIGKANNARTRKVVLGLLLGSADLPFWSVKYRSKMRRCLTHAWGRRAASILREICRKPAAAWGASERAMLSDRLFRHAPDRDPDQLAECFAFVLGGERAWTHPLLVAFDQSRTDLEQGRRLPLEVLEGIRGTYHPTVPAASLLALVRSSLSAGQRLNAQRRAREQGIQVDVDFAAFDPVRLYLYAYEMGMTDEIERILDDKARHMAARFPFAYGRVGVLVDSSASLAGSRSQPLRPMATALAIRDLLRAAAGDVRVHYSGGRKYERLVTPRGDTSLARGLLALLEGGPDVVFILSDGYENRTAGRLAEVVARLPDAGIATPVFHLNPVMAAEVQGVRSLAGAGLVTIPIAQPASLATALIRGSIEVEPVPALAALLEMTDIPSLQEGAPCSSATVSP